MTTTATDGGVVGLQPAARRAHPPAPVRFRTVALIWCVPAAIAVVHAAVQFAVRGVAGRPWALLPLTFAGWLIWAALTPPIIRLTRRFPFRRERMGSALAAHVPAAVLSVVLIDVVWSVLAGTVMNAPGTAIPAAERLSFTRWSAGLNPVGHDLIGIFTYACIAAATTAADAMRSSHRAELAAARLERDVAQAREQAIKMQVHPHFLFNTLHAVSVLVTEDPPTARAMVVHLGDFLRATLDRAGRSEVALAEELDLLVHYLAVEQLRFGDRLVVEVDAPEDVMEALVPDLVLQPLVENAIKHGVSSRTGAHRVVVRARREGPRLVLTVDDDGAGPPPSPGPEGVGLGATRQRLAHLYGEGHALELAARPGGGTRASVVLPFHLEPLGASDGGAGGGGDA